MNEMNSAMQDRYDMYCCTVEMYLAGAFEPEGRETDGLRDVMTYALAGGGKRIRPVLCLEFAGVCGGNMLAALPVACGVEMLHTYSLIHDDLPCMDNDDMRRGRPSCHKQYGETAAVLAGDCLQAEAFRSVCAAGIADTAKAKCCALLAESAGIFGICGGQYMDLTEKNPGRDRLIGTDMGKTASLMGAACAMGAAAAGADESKISAAKAFGKALGMAFQCRDDMLDGDGLCALLGREKCGELASQYTDEALSVLDNFEDTAFLRALTLSLAQREN